MEILASFLVYAGLLTSFLGCVSLLRPLTFLGIASRSQAALVLFGGVVLVLAGFVFPGWEMKVAAPQTQLDRFVPGYQFQEFHSIHIKASPEKVFQAIKEVRANEIRLFRTLTWIRRFGRPGPESILNAPETMPLIEVATRTSFLLLAEEKDREIVLGTLVASPPGWRRNGKPTPEGFQALKGPGFGLAALNFHLEEAGVNETIVTTETRVYATDRTVRRKFAPYWRTIYPGSALIRVMWLRAIKKRAEGPPG